jgi:hypothetical protein
MHFFGQRISRLRKMSARTQFAPLANKDWLDLVVVRVFHNGNSHGIGDFFAVTSAQRSMHRANGWTTELRIEGVGCELGRRRPIKRGVPGIGSCPGDS